MDDSDLFDSESDLDDNDSSAKLHICGNSVENNYREVNLINKNEEAVRFASIVSFDMRVNNLYQVVDKYLFVF